MHNFSIQVVIARGLFSRLVGLLGKNQQDVQYPFYIPRCKQIHTVGMKFALDLVFVSKEGVVVAMQNDIKPNRFSKYVSQAFGVMEFVSGSVAYLGLQVGDSITMQKIGK